VKQLHLAHQLPLVVVVAEVPIASVERKLEVLEALVAVELVVLAM
jgi:hypothetical protein